MFCASWGIGVIVNCGNLGPTLIISAYLVTNSTSKTAVAPVSSRILAEMGDFIQLVGLNTCVGADWQMEPSILSHTMFLDTLGKSIKNESSGLLSCIAGGGCSSSNIDYFAMHKALGDVAGSVSFCPITPPRPHRPVVLEFQCRPKSEQVMVVKEPTRLPLEAPFGPAFPPWWLSDYSDVLGQLGGLDEAANGTNYVDYSVDEVTAARCGISDT